MKRFHIILAAALVLSGCAADKHDENITVVVSLDAFRWDYPEIFDTPTLDEIATEGVAATMMPSFPASTFPNHYTLATGLYPDHTGIVNSSFWDEATQKQYSMGDNETRNDPGYYSGEPIWNTAQRQGVRAASIYWVGSDIAINGSMPQIMHYWNDEPRFDYAGRVGEALRILSLPENERPRLLMVYFDDPDATTHEFGPLSAEGGIMVHYLDSLMGVLYDGIKALPYADKVNLIITSDHGMTDISNDRIVFIPDYVKEEWCEHIVGTSPTNIYSKPQYRDSILNALRGVEHISVWEKGCVPPEYHYGTHPHEGDIIVAPDCGWQFAPKERSALGAHGYCPLESDMQVAFRACGPDFKKGYLKEDKFPNVDLYPMLCHLLGIKPAPVDGDLRGVRDMFVR